MEVYKKMNVEDLREEIKYAIDESSKILDIIDAVDTTAGIELTRSGVEMIREATRTSGLGLKEALAYLNRKTEPEIHCELRGKEY